MIVVIVWIVLCFIVASVGTHKNIGYWGTFVISLFFSPLVGLIFGLISSDLKKPEIIYTCKYCGLKTKVNSHFCPACDKDDNGMTKEQHNEKTV